MQAGTNQVSVKLTPTSYAASVPGVGIVQGSLKGIISHILLCSASIRCAFRDGPYFDLFLVNEIDKTEFFIIQEKPGEIVKIMDGRGLVLRREQLKRALPLLLESLTAQRRS